MKIEKGKNPTGEERIGRRRFFTLVGSSVLLGLGLGLVLLKKGLSDKEKSKIETKKELSLEEIL